jgi:DNA-binding HxlR family transcriptional regulator
LKINLLADMDEMEHRILTAIFQAQVQNKGMSWGELLELDTIGKKMSRQTFSHRLQDLQKRGLVVREEIKNKRGKPTYYRLNSGLYSELDEFREKFYPWAVEKEIRDFEKDIESHDTAHYVDAMMELALSRLIVLGIALSAFQQEGARWLFYEANYQNIEQILQHILERASRSKIDKEQTLSRLFEILEPYSERAIGKRFALDDVYNSKQAVIKAIVNTHTI